MLVTVLLVAANLVVANLAVDRPPRPPAPAPPPIPTAAPTLAPISDEIWAGPSCSVDFLRELRRHPHWTIRIDAYEDRECGLSPAVRDAILTITDHDARWQRDGRERYDGQSWTGDPMPQQLELTSDERARVLAALDSICTDTREPVGRWNLAVAIDPTDEPVAPLRSAALEDLLGELHDRYTASRLALARGLSAHLSYRIVDDSDRIVRRRIDVSGHGVRVQWADGTETFDASDDTLVDVLDCLASLPEGDNPVLSGTLVVGNQKLWIAAPRTAVANATCLSRALQWRPSERLVATPTRYLPPENADYLAHGWAGFDEAVGRPTEDR